VSARIVLLVTSPRLPAGLLTAQAWDLVRSHPVLTAGDGPQPAALRAAGADVRIVEPAADRVLAETTGTVVWLAGPAGDADLARELGLRLAREPGLAELELMYGSWDPAGARLLDAVSTMDRLVSPGGDPWKRAQTHTTLAQYLLEEAYEAYDAILSGDLHAVREELGDVLLQVVLHARLAEDASDDDGRFTVDDVAGDLVDKLIRRNPHVFADAAVHSLDEITENWEQIKRAEKSRTSALDGIPLALPALALAAKVLARAERAGLPSTVDGSDLGSRLLRAVADARADGLDAEAALRVATLELIDRVRRDEQD
jgi:XTP/dITP diphosphohydrolase